MRYIGIDYGTKKTGIALSDESGSMGFPHSIRPTDIRLLDELALLIRQQQVERIVFGDSKNLHGGENAVAAEAKRFSEDLSARTGLPVFFESELFTTQQARRMPDGTRKEGELVDSQAAALILTSFLERIAGEKEREDKEGEKAGAAEAAPAPEPEQPARISIDDFAKVEVKVGTVLSAERVPETDKLLRLMVDLGEEVPRQIVSGIAAYVTDPQELVGRQLSFVANLAPRKIKGLESNGMLFAVGEGDTFAFVVPDRIVPPGTSAH